MAWYKTGTVEVSNEGTSVVGTGTSWVANVRSGMAFIGPDGGTYEIASVQSDTALTLATPYGGADDTEGAYSIQPTQDYTRSLATVGAELITKYSEAVNLWERGEFSAGTVELPGVNFDGTANGLYMPEANTVGIVTDGVERLRVEADGTVEIAGAASIGQGLSVSGDTSLSGAVSVTGNTSVTGNASVTGNMTVGGNTALGPLTLNRSNNDSTSRGHVTVTRGSGAGTVFTINSENTGANDVSALSILAGPLGSGVERLRLTSTGTLGLGTAAPTFDGARNGAHIHNSAASQGTQVRLTHAGTGATATDGFIIDVGTNGVSSLWNYENAALAFATNNTERMRLDAAGNLGIGGAAPANGRTLAVQNSGTGAAVIYAQNSTTGYAANNGMTMQLSSSDGYLWNYGNGTMVFGTNNAEVARFTAAGNLAIGATSSAYPLYVYRAAADVGAMLASGTAGNATLYLNANGVAQNWLRTERATGDLVVATADTARARFMYNGDYVLGGTAATNYSGAGYRTLALNHSTGGILEFQAGGVQQARLTGWGNTFGVHTENIERVRVNSSGVVLQGTTRLGVGINPTSQIHAYSASGSTNIHAQSGGSTAGNFGQMIVSTATNMWSIGSEGGTGRFFLYNGNAGRDQLKFGGGSVDSGISLEALGAGGIDFATGNATRLSIMPNGNIGIGGNPSNPLDVFRTTDGLGIRTRNTTSAREVSLGTTANSGYISSGNADLSFHRDGTEVMRLNGTNVGIGTVATSAKLHILDGANTQIILDTTGSGNLQMGQHTNGAWIGTTSSTSTVGVLRMATAGIEAMRLDTQQRLCIGKTTSLGYKVDIQGQIGVEDGTIRAGWGPGMFTAGTMGFGTTSAHTLTLGTNAITRMQIMTSGHVHQRIPTTEPTLTVAGEMSMRYVSDTQLKFSMRGSDGVTRSVTLTLA